MNNSDFASLDLVPTPLFVLNVSSDSDITYAFFNKSALDVANFGQDDYMGLNATHLYHGEYGELAFEKHTECYLSAKPSTYVLSLPISGKLRSIRTRLMPVLDSSGQVTQIVGASIDVTAEYALDEIREESRSIDKELQEFLYLAAHDLRSPMQKVRACSEMLREDFQDMGDGKLELINILEKVSIESMAMIHRVLQYAETTGIDESIENFSLAEITDGILTTLEPGKLNNYHIDDCSILGDRVLIQTVLRNIVDNAIKHNACEAITLNVTATNTKSDYFSMTISDTGIGVSAPELLFKDTQSNHSTSGFGLLAIRQLIKRAGGEIFAEHPIEGTGLVVTIILPGRVT